MALTSPVLQVGFLLSSLLSLGCLSQQCAFGGAPRDESSLLQVKDKHGMSLQAPCRGSVFPMLKTRSNRSMRPNISNPVPASLLTTSGLQQKAVPLLAYPYSDYLLEMVLEIKPGTGSVTLPVSVDTGSTSFAVLGYDYCINYYDGECISDGTASLSYVDGSGWYANICSFDSSYISVGEYGTDVFFGSIYQQQDFIRGCNGALGIAGAGFANPNGNDLEKAPLFWALTSANNLPAVLGMTACKFGTEINGGRLQIGGTDPAYGNAYLQTVTVQTTQGYWSVYVSAFVIEVQGSITTDLTGPQLFGTDSSVQTIIDSGNDAGFAFVQTVYETVIADIASALDPLSGSTCITFDDLSVNMPIMSIGFEGVVLQFQGQDWFPGGSITLLQQESCVFNTALSGQEMVNSLITNQHLFVSRLDSNNNLGQGLLEVYYTEFRQSVPEIAFGPRTICD